MIRNNEPNALSGVSFWDFLVKDYPEIDGQLIHEGAYSREIPCPICGGHTKFRYRAAEGQYPEMVFCNTCGPMSIVKYVMKRQGIADKQDAINWILHRPADGKVAKPHTVVGRPERPLYMRMAQMHHRAPGNWRGYFHGRFITDSAINRYRLGWNAKKQRYSIPCFQRNPTTGQMELHGMQYRITPEQETQLCAAGEKPVKYISEYGSHNHRLFNSYRVKGKKLPYLLLVEGPLDVITLAEWGRPAVATFQGNNEWKPWDIEWNRFMHCAEVVLVIPDNDPGGQGERFAMKKQSMIPNSRIWHLPTGVKDVGELIHQWAAQGWGPDHIQCGLSEWLQCRPPVPNY